MAPAEVYKYNPRLIPPDELQATFVAREAIRDDILGELRARASAPANQHFLIIGPRGIGKTNLLLMLRYGVLGDETLAKAYLPLQTAEEEYSIAHLRHLFTKVLTLIIEQAPDEEVKGRLESIEAMADDDQAAEAAIEAARSFAQRSARKLLLLVDNLDLILGDQLRDDAQLGRLRDILMNEAFLVLIGAAPTYFDEVSGYGRPFYNFFRTINLQDLTPDQIVAMLRKRAAWDGNRTILDHLDELPPRIKAVHHLTGGNPRLVLMLYQLCTASELPEVRTAVQALLDDVTPYYKSRLEQLPAQQRRVMDAFARLGRPATPTELAAELRLPVNQINSILQRLRETGFVTLAPQERRKKTYYMVSERLFRIWHQMRFSTATSRRIQFLIDFLRIWYTPEEWEMEAERLLTAYQMLAAEKRYAEGGRLIECLSYLADAAPAAEPAIGIVARTVEACVESGDIEHAEELLEGQRQQYEREAKHHELAWTWFLTSHLRAVQGKPLDEIKALQSALAIEPDLHDARFNLGVTLAELAANRTGSEREATLSQAIACFQALAAVAPNRHDALYNWGKTLEDLAEEKNGQEKARLLEQAIDKYGQALRVKPDKHEALDGWGRTLGRLADTMEGSARADLLQQAVGRFQAAASIAPNDHVVLYNWALALMRLAGEQTGPDRGALLREAAQRFRAASTAKPDASDALYNWGMVLAELAEGTSGVARVDLLQQAMEKYRAALALRPDMHDALHNWGSALTLLSLERQGAEQQALLRDAVEKYRAAGELAPQDYQPLRNWAFTLALLAGDKTGPEASELRGAAGEKASEAIRRAAGRGDREGVVYCSALLAQISLTQCASAIGDDDYGSAREAFARALDAVGKAEKDLVWHSMGAFWSSVAGDTCARICQEFLDMMRARGMEGELAVLEPYVRAVEYWQKGRDAEVLDRLNPEVREIVEEIIRRGEEKNGVG